jgi:hypothetical protein
MKRRVTRAGDDLDDPAKHRHGAFADDVDRRGGSARILQT